MLRAPVQQQLRFVTAVPTQYQRYPRADTSARSTYSMASKPLAVISGVARTHGIGRECVRVFLEAGYRVLGVDVAPQEDPALHHTDFQFSTADITNVEQTKQVAALVSDYGGLQVLVNNAGIANPFPPEGSEDKIMHWFKVIEINLTGAFLLSEALLPHMTPGKSSIIHMSSIRARQSEPNTEAYGAAKAGLVGLTHAQAVTQANKVRVNAVLPGWIYTESNRDELTKQDHEWHPSGRVGMPSDVAQLCLFLADESKAKFITGQDFAIDGGVSKKLIYLE